MTLTPGQIAAAARNAGSTVTVTGMAAHRGRIRCRHIHGWHHGRSACDRRRDGCAVRLLGRPVPGTFPVPVAGRGPQTVTAVGLSSGARALANFLVLPPASMAIAPWVGNPAPSWPSLARGSRGRVGGRRMGGRHPRPLCLPPRVPTLPAMLALTSLTVAVPLTAALAGGLLYPYGLHPVLRRPGGCRRVSGEPAQSHRKS